MPRELISRTRFNWKSSPWSDLKNIQNLWLYSKNGLVTFELELDPSVSIPHNGQNLHAKNSRNKNKKNFMKILEPRISQQLRDNLPKFDVCGAKNRAIIVGKINIILGTQEKNLLVMSTLKDWRDWLEHRRNYGT